MDLGLAGSAFLVTAASEGLGYATARALVAEGAGVLLVARRPDRLQSAVESLGDDRRAYGLSADLADPDTADRAVRAAQRAFGRLDGALISVGGPPPGQTLELTDRQWRAGFESVFLAALRVIRGVLAVNPAARLGLVLSSSARSPLPRMAISNGLRPGLAMLVKQLADEIGPAGGRVFGLLPGFIATRRLIELDATRTDPQAYRATAEAAIPLRRYGLPDEFGRLAAFLLSDAASYLTGCLIPVDGGFGRAL